jgi:hypothetical protein
MGAPLWGRQLQRRAVVTAIAAVLPGDIVACMETPCEILFCRGVAFDLVTNLSFWAKSGASAYKYTEGRGRS